MNKIILMGRLVADPEFSMTTSGMARCTFRIAVDRPVRQGEEKQSDFFRITCWDKTAETVNRYFVKGKPILLEGRIQNDNYTDRDGVKHYQDQIIADRINFVLSDPTRTGSGNSGRRSDDYDNDRYDDDRYRRSSSRRNDRYDDDDDYRRDSRRRNDRYDDDDRDRRRNDRYDDDNYRRDSRRDEDDDRRRDAQDEERRSASSQPKKDIQLGNDDADSSDLGDFKEIISENDLPF